MKLAASVSRARARGAACIHVVGHLVINICSAPCLLSACTLSDWPTHAAATDGRHVTSHWRRARDDLIVFSTAKGLRDKEHAACVKFWCFLEVVFVRQFVNFRYNYIVYYCIPCIILIFHFCLHAFVVLDFIFRLYVLSICTLLHSCVFRFTNSLIPRSHSCLLCLQCMSGVV